MRAFRALIIAILVMTLTAATALADPIVCPPGQRSEKVDGVWTCVNHPEQGNPNTGETRNPTD